MTDLKLALTKGRIEKKTVELFEKIGYDCSEIKEKGRKLILKVTDSNKESPVNLEVMLAKPDDVITYIEHGACDLGIVGKDTILEKGGDFYEVADLKFGVCRFSLAYKLDTDFYADNKTKIIATKYPNITKNFFEKKHMDISIVKIEGSVEIAPLLGIADAIVDIVETGSTLAANGLKPYEDVVPYISSRLIVNTASMKLRHKEIISLLSRL